MSAAISTMRSAIEGLASCLGFHPMRSSSANIVSPSVSRYNLRLIVTSPKRVTIVLSYKPTTRKPEGLRLKSSSSIAFNWDTIVLRDNSQPAL